MTSPLYRSTSILLSAALLIVVGFGDALHSLPGMGHAGHCHGWTCHSASSEHGHQHHLHDGHSHGASTSCCGHSHKSLPDTATALAETSGQFDGTMRDQHDCGLCKLLASLKQVTPATVAMHQWHSLSVAQSFSELQRPESNFVLAYQGRAPPISL